MKNTVERIYLEMVEVQKHHVWPILFLIITVTAFFAFFAMNIEVDSSLDQQVRPEDDFLTIQNIMANEFGQTDAFFVVVSIDNSSGSTGAAFDIRDPEAIEAVERMQHALEEDGEVSSGVSIAGIFRQVFGRLPNSLEESKEWIRLLGKDADAFVNKDSSATIIIASVNIPKKPGALGDLQKRMQEKVDEVSLPAGVKAVLTGSPTLLDRIINLMIRDNIQTMAVALVFIFLSLAFLFRKLSLAIISVIPVIIAVIWLGGTMALFDIRLSVANAMVAAMVMGLGVDYAVHLTNSFDAMIKKNTKKPISKTMKVIGTALFISFITTLIGFGVNLLNTTEAGMVQGLTLALGITFSFVATMIVTPVLLKLKIEILREEHGEHRWK